MKYIRGSYARRSDCFPYCSQYGDHFIDVKLATEPAEERVIARNNRLAGFLVGDGRLDGSPVFSFFPPALGPGAKKSRLVEAVMTGGRTFLLTRRGSAELGLSPSVYLDLVKLGWGDGLLELRPEVKGAGTLFERTRLSPMRVEQVLRRHPRLRAGYNDYRGTHVTPVLISSRADFMKRNIGGQSERCARQAVEASSNMLGKSSIRFVPVWLAVAQSPAVHENLEIFSRALHKDEPRHSGIWACELRFTPSTVRALYFDLARDDDELIRLCSYVSRDAHELAETLEQMIVDVRRYLEVLASTTQPAAVGYTWIKIGDISEKFKPDERGEYSAAMVYRKRQCAWFIAKDEVVVRRVGKFFTDMESYFGKDVGFHSPSDEALWFHHELYILTVLRDHLRVCTRFAIGTELVRRRRVSSARRKALSKSVATRIVEAVNESSAIRLALGPNDAAVGIAYERLGNLAKEFIIPRIQLAERDS